MDGCSHGSTIPVTKGKRAKGTSTRRTWGKHEEAILMDLFKELIASGGGWKTENGFRSGYLQKLEERLREKIPGTDLRPTPHINSRITIWKRHHAAIQCALGDSGGGFNSETKILDVSDIAWEKAVNKESTVANMRYKPWPFYFDWLELFGNDGATGNSSQTVIDVVNDLVNENAGEDATGSEEEATTSQQGAGKNNLDEDGPCEMDVESQAPTMPPPSPSAPSSSNKRVAQSAPGNNRELLDGLDVLFRTSDERLANMVHSIVVHPVQPIPTMPNQPTYNRSAVFDMFQAIPDLTLDERLDASEKILKSNCWELFIGLPEDARPRYVRHFLDGDFN